ncbi:MAG: sulfate transporter CysZ [Gammaproteobacteria bacterium]
MAAGVTAVPAGFIAGMRHVSQGFALIRAPGVRVFVIIPLLINIALFALALFGVSRGLDYAIETYLASWPAWIQWLIWMLFALLSAIVVFFTFSVAANIVASPFNGLLADAVEQHLRGRAVSVQWTLRELAAEFARTLLGELRKLLYIGWRALPLLVLSFIPGLNLAAPPLWLLFGAWMLCLEYLDCPLGNHGQVFPRVLDEMRQRRRLALGFGFAMTLVTIVPLLNFLAVPVGVAGATRLYCTHVAPR